MQQGMFNLFSGGFTLKLQGMWIFLHQGIDQIRAPIGLHSLSLRFDSLAEAG
jgi:hypothetical protein